MKQKNIATISFKYPLDLAKQYDLVRPALFHNTLINTNSKKRGFYYHFTQDLLKKLKKQNLIGNPSNLVQIVILY